MDPEKKVTVETKIVNMAGDDGDSKKSTSVKLTGVPHRLKITEAMTDNQWRTLLAIMDTIIPSIQRESKAPKKKSLSVAYISDERYDSAIDNLRRNTVLFDNNSEEEIEGVLAENPSDDILFQQQLQGMLLTIPQQTKRQLLLVLSIMRCAPYRVLDPSHEYSKLIYFNSTQGLTMALTGTWTPFTNLPIEDRTRILQNWSKSIIPDLRGLFRQMNTLAKVIYTATNARYHAITGYPATPIGWSPQSTYPFDFIQFPAEASPSEKPAGSHNQPNPPIDLEYDIVIVGSGCGAGVCAKTLSEAGHRVVVVEKGYHFDASSFPMAQGPHFFWLLDGAGAVNSDNNAILVVSASNVGGGGTINWSASLQPQGFVRQEWYNKGLTLFGTQEFQDCCDRVYEQMGVHENFTPNHGNQALLDGARKLGWTAKKVPQNTGACEHADGQCALGCWRGEKNGPVNGWFPDAARAGCQFIEGMKVDKVLFDEKKGKKKAVGVVGTWTSRGPDGLPEGPDQEKIVRKVKIRAKKVIVSGGTMWSPILLKKSGIRVSQTLHASIRLISMHKLTIDILHYRIPKLVETCIYTLSTS